MIETKRTVPLADWRPTEKQKQSVADVVSSGRLTYGPLSRELEALMAQATNRKYSIFVNSGTSGLQVALHYLKEVEGWDDSAEVIVPSVTFVASLNTVLQNRLTPVLTDVDSGYFEMEAEKLVDSLTEKTRVVMPVDLLGLPCDIQAIKKVVAEHSRKIGKRIWIVEDSCETLGVNINGWPVGSQADIAIYSSYLAHIISTGVGGFITVNESKAERDMRSMIWHGRDDRYLDVDQNDKLPIDQLLEARYRFDKPGYSYRLTEMEAALGIDELDRLSQTVEIRQQNAQFLTNELLPLVDKVQLPMVRAEANHAWMFYPILVDPNIRNRLAYYLEQHGVQTRWIMPLTNQPVYRSWLDQSKYPIAEMINNSGMLLPCHHFLVEEDMVYIGQVVRQYFDEVS